MIRFIAYALAAVIAALATATISERLLQFDTAQSVIMFGLVMGVIGAFIKPIVGLLAMPINCLTFGLFSLVINAALFGLGSYLVSGIDVSWWPGYFVGAILVSIASGVIFSVLDE